jgi:hypothetical protein
MPTKGRYDNHSTEFGLWLWEQSEIDSGFGFVATNLDYIWANYKTGEWMLIEEKRHGSSIKFYQQKLFDKIDKLCEADSLYYGFHKLVFENTSPDDGNIWLDGKLISKVELLQFLQFKML